MKRLRAYSHQAKVGAKAKKIKEKAKKIKEYTANIKENFRFRVHFCLARTQLKRLCVTYLQHSHMYDILPPYMCKY